jgi:hypothetical protein
MEQPGREMDTRNGKEDMPTEKHKNYHRRGY